MSSAISRKPVVNLNLYIHMLPFVFALLRPGFLRRRLFFFLLLFPAVFGKHIPCSHRGYCRYSERLF
jgi:hypothetical protein